MATETYTTRVRPAVYKDNPPISKSPTYRTAETPQHPVAKNDAKQTNRTNFGYLPSIGSSTPPLPTKYWRGLITATQ